MKLVSLNEDMQNIVKSKYEDNQISEGSKYKFSETLESTIDEIKRLRQDADKHANALAVGEEKDIHQTMIAFEKAAISFKLLMQIRNKIIEAYKQIERMAV